MKPFADPRPFRPLARRLVIMVVAVCAGCAALAILVQGYRAWTDTVRSQRHAIEDISHGHLSALSSALWDIDTRRVQSETELVVRHPEVAGVLLTTAGGLEFTAGDAAAAGRAQAQITVPHQNAGGEPLGHLKIAFHSGYAGDMFAQALMQTVVGIALVATLTAVLVIRFLRRELSEPLRCIADYARDLSPEDGAAALTLPRGARAWKDDLDLVVEAFHTMHAGLRRYVVERNEAQRKLADERDRLDAAVRERTADLLNVNRFLAQLAQLSARLIDLPLENYPDALRSALAELAREVGAGACVLAELEMQGRWTWRFAGGPRLGNGTVWPAEGISVPPGEAQMSAAMAALSQALDAPVTILAQRQSGRAAHVLAAAKVESSQTVPSGQLQLVADVLFGALTRWRGLLELEQTRRRLLHQSRSDPLTGLANRREFDERKFNELRRARRMGQPITLMMVDIDHFKLFNDNYGHGAGDECLVRVAGALRALFQRPSDCVARIGGEEFAILLPDTSAEHAAEQGHRVLEAVMSLDVPHAGSHFGRVTVSLGAATLDRHDSAPVEAVFERLARTADEALYRAKASGRGVACHAAPGLDAVPPS